MNPPTAGDTGTNFEAAAAQHDAAMQHHAAKIAAAQAADGQPALDGAVLAALTAAGEAGATSMDLEKWIVQNHSPGGVSAADLGRSIGRLRQTGAVRSEPLAGFLPVGTRFYAGGTRPDCVDRAALDQAIAATVAAHPGCVSNDNVQAWIDPALLAVVPPRAALVASLDRLCEAGTIWQQGARGAYFTERHDCPDCETNGVNCPQHRADSA